MELAKLKICFLAGTLGQGGAERQLYYVLRCLQQAGAQARVLSFRRNDFWEDRLRAAGVRVVTPMAGASKLRRLAWVTTQLHQDRPDVFQSQHFYTSAYVGVAARLLGLAGVGAIRSNGIMDVQTAGVIAGWFGLHAPDVLVANSRAGIRYAAGKGIPPGRLYFLGNVVDTSQIRPVPRFNAMGARLLAVGSLVQSKRLDRFLRILARLRREFDPSISGLIVGDGPLTSELKSQAAALGLLPTALEFKGRVADVAEVYGQADVFMLASDYEGTPNVVLEAMAAGLPVVATKVGGVTDIVVDSQTGFLAEPNDEQGLYDLVRRLFADVRTRLRMGQQARAFVEEHHALATLPGKLFGLYRFVGSACHCSRWSGAGPNLRGCEAGR